MWKMAFGQTDAAKLRQVPDSNSLRSIRQQLKIIRNRDQKIRTGGDSLAFSRLIDSTNQVYIQALIAKYGWMGKSFIGDQNSVLFLVIQHADSAIQEKYFPMLKQSVEEGESRKSDFALMQDRILMRRGKKQVYGSQVIKDAKGDWVFYSIEDEKNVNLRRSSMGLQPMEEYAKYFGITYKTPVEKK
jgi:hypothetical protein